MPSSKDRLYVGLYACGGQGYHWALLTGPKSEATNARGKRYHAKQKNMVWEFSEQSISMGPTNMILVRLLVAKVTDSKKLETILRGLPLRSDQPGWTCKSWVKEAVEKLQNGRAINCSLDWNALSETAIWYVEKKITEHQFDGKAEQCRFNRSRVSTWSILDGYELAS